MSDAPLYSNFSKDELALLMHSARLMGCDTDEFEDILREAAIDEEYKNSLLHYGTPRHSGRYPWGSGENPYQHSSYFMSEVNRMRKEGKSDNEIAATMNMSSGEFRSKITIAKEKITAENRQRALDLYGQGYTKTKIAEIMGVSEGTVRNYLKPQEYKSGKPTTANMALYLKDQVDAKGMIDVGTGVELSLGITDVRLNAALKQLEDEGYSVINKVMVEQSTNPGKYTQLRVLAPPGTTRKDVYNNLGDIHTIESYDQYAQAAEEKHPGFERTKYGLYYPQSLDSSRIMIRYAEDGGKEKDGVIELRRGVDDISLGKSNYAQVRIMTDDKYYLKGMAMYSDDMPDGVDVIFNTNKHVGTEMGDVFKPLKTNKQTGEIDRDNPFGAAIKSEEDGGQRFYTGEDGKQHLSVINIVNAEGDWGEWSKTLSSQFLSKQNLPLVKKQLDLSYSNKVDEYRDILQLTNPIVKQYFLDSFAEDCDASAVHLKATSLPRQASHVILPIPELSDKEIYAPKYDNGDTVVLIRYPHAGTFEIPELKVNNNNPVAADRLGQATDAVGINPKVAEQLSGADFDGDTVMVIPVSKGGVGTKVKTEPYLRELKEFSETGISKYEITDKNDPLYLVDAAHGFHKQTEMGKVSNLITDMTLLGATNEEIARAVKHSMIVIDAEKHHYDWRQSEIDNGIKELKTKYQGGPNAGAATLISKASSDKRIDKVKPQYTLYLQDENGNDVLDENGNRIQLVKNGVDVRTGEKVYRRTGETYHKPIYEYEKDENGSYILDEKTGKKRKVSSKPVAYEEKATPRQTKTTKMADTNDAMTLVSNARNPVELAYANYANNLKDLANQARLESINTKPIPYDKSAKEAYAAEVQSLKDKLTIAQKNAPRERQAQIAAAVIYKAKRQDNPNMSAEEEKKVKSQALAEQRVRYGAHKDRIDITEREWEAIQAGAIHVNTLRDILKNTDSDKLRELAMPNNYKNTVSPYKEQRIQDLANSGYTQAEIANIVGLSASTVSNYLLDKR